MLRRLILKIVSPVQLWKAYSVSKRRKSVSRAAEDPQLKLYDRILKTDFLHYGYFDNPQIEASDISLNDIRRGQIRYAELIINQIKDEGPVLDVGCGMGGLIKMLLAKNLEVTGITPDRVQIDYISKKYPAAKLIRAKFQNMPVEDYRGRFSSVIHSESLQYMGLDKALKNVKAILKPTGRWIVVDYFRTGQAAEKSGHYWDNFLQKLAENNLKVVYSQDITENIKPTLAHIYMWGNEIGKPLFEFLSGKLAKKHPGKHFLLQDTLAELTEKMNKNLAIVDPATFAQNKKYVLLSIESAD
jgi:cyclopropane fatty-acyl-phospholipid synthase-like methyltransferase